MNEGGHSSNGFIRFGSLAVLQGPTTPLLKNGFDNYHLNLKGIWVDFRKLNIPEHCFGRVPGDPDDMEAGFIIDSGTTITVLCVEAYNELTKEVDDRLSEYRAPAMDRFTYCYSNLATAPFITFELENMNYTLTNANAWIDYDDDGAFYCLAIVDTMERLSILGMHQLRRVNVGYNLDTYELSLDTRYGDGCPV
ncbi:hypothetical protein RJ640_025851 [Escallonia rubra]|uniref:Peptidase A1 domain-containing protein n=1 Tax=Escallonia rubra TaxID=112253 RepID=A0AA88U3E6_9ASTE|nr:hypothetical protein RJ640_025851 [Escallonia rubra]